MREDRIRKLLRETPIPHTAEAEQLGLQVVSEAFAQRQAPPARPLLPRLAIALAICTLLAALLLSPAGAAVRDWIDEVFTAGVPDAQPALTEVPGGGRLLVQSASGPWVVQSDGSRRLLGRYEEATWSPRGLFVGTAQGHTLSAVEPDGTVRWTLSADAPVADPRWSSSGVRIAYRAGRMLRVVAGNGDEDVVLDGRVEPLPAVWNPQGLHWLAYVDAAESLRVVNADTGEILGSTEALPGVAMLGWSPDGSALLEASPGSLRLHSVTTSKLAGNLDLGQPRHLQLPAGATVGAVAFSPDDGTIAALLDLAAGGERRPRSEVVLIDRASGSLQRLFAAPGRLSGLAWSPNGSRLLIAWPDADQWLFIPINRRGRVRAIGGISREFSPGARGSAPFPRVEGWCCPASIGSSAR